MPHPLSTFGVHRVVLRNARCRDIIFMSHITVGYRLKHQVVSCNIVCAALARSVNRYINKSAHRNETKTHQCLMLKARSWPRQLFALSVKEVRSIYLLLPVLLYTWLEPTAEDRGQGTGGFKIHLHLSQRFQWVWRCWAMYTQEHWRQQCLLLGWTCAVKPKPAPLPSVNELPYGCLAPAETQSDLRHLLAAPQKVCRACASLQKLNPAAVFKS